MLLRRWIYLCSQISKIQIKYGTLLFLFSFCRYVGSLRNDPVVDCLLHNLVCVAEVLGCGAWFVLQAVCTRLDHMSSCSYLCSLDIACACCGQHGFSFSGTFPRVCMFDDSACWRHSRNACTHHAPHTHATNDEVARLADCISLVSLILHIYKKSIHTLVVTAVHHQR